MIKNYFTIAFRTLWKSKSFSGLNILGLSLGIACSLLILLWVQDERSVDGFHANKDRLYVVYGRGISPERVRAGYDNPGPLGQELKKTIPEIAMAAVYYFPAADWQVKLSVEHYFTSSQGSPDFTAFFADASAKYRVKKWNLDLQLEATNFLNVRSYRALALAANTLTASSYTLPGRIVLGKIMFNL
jgi:hypothetical protein